MTISNLVTAAMEARLEYGSAVMCWRLRAYSFGPGVLAIVLNQAVHLSMYAVAETLVSLPAAERIPPELLLDFTKVLLTHAVKISGESECFPSETFVSFGLQKAVKDMSSRHLLELFSIVRQYGRYHIVKSWLSKLPAADNIPADVMQQQMQEGVQQHDDHLLSALCSFPAAVRVDADVLLQLYKITSSGESENCRDMQGCFITPRLASQMQLNGRQLKAFMLAAISSEQRLREFKDKTFLVSQLTADDVADLFYAAVKQDDARTWNVEILCRFPAAKDLSSPVLAAIISAALDYKRTIHILTSLCALPAAR